MKEVLTKKFWQDVKKTFDEAREDPPLKDSNPGPTVSPNANLFAPLPEPSAPSPEAPDEKL